MDAAARRPFVAASLAVEASGDDVAGLVERLAVHDDVPVAGIGLAVAAWMRYALGVDESGAAIDVRDPLGPRFSAIAAEKIDDSESIVERFLGLTEVFGTDLPRNPRFSAVVTGALRKLLDQGAAATVQEFARSGAS
jgi:fructuronate reductase